MIFCGGSTISLPLLCRQGLGFLIWEGGWVYGEFCMSVCDYFRRMGNSAAIYLA